MSNVTNNNRSQVLNSILKEAKERSTFRVCDICNQRKKTEVRKHRDGGTYIDVCNHCEKDLPSEFWLKLN